MPSLSIWSVQHFKNTLDLGLEPFHPSKDLRPRAEELETTCTILNLEKIQLEFFYFFNISRNSCFFQRFLRIHIIAIKEAQLNRRMVGSGHNSHAWYALPKKMV